MCCQCIDVLLFHRINSNLVMAIHFLCKPVFLFVTGAFLCSSPAFAQLDPAAANPADEARKPDELKQEKQPPENIKAELVPANNPVQKVTIQGGRQADLDERRRSTASRMIFGREELDRNGDSTIADVLKRLPGVTIGGASRAWR